MSDLRTIVRRELDGVDVPDLTLERFHGRRIRQSRNRRLIVGAVAAGIGLAAVLLATGAFTKVPPLVPAGPSHEPTPSEILDGMWPQATMQEAIDAQRRADAGDADVLWQTRLDPAQAGPGNTGAELAERFVEQELGWTDFHLVTGFVKRTSLGFLVLIRCDEGAVNPMYPDGPGAGCAPTITDTRYETVKINVSRPITKGRGGIWVITSATRLAPDEAGQASWWREFEQAVPPTTAEIQDTVRAFLDARVAGSGAEEFLYLDPSHEQEDLESVQLYATTDGTPYQRAELASMSRPSWPTGELRVTLRLFPEGSDRVVEESVVLRSVDAIRREGGGLIFDYHKATSRREPR